MQRIDMRTVTMDIPPQDVITRDNVSVKVNAVLYFRVVDPEQGGDRGGGLSLRHLAAGADDTAQRLRTSRARRPALGARQAEHPAAGDPRPADRPVGDQGGDRRDQAHRSAAGDAARHGRAKPRPSASAAPRSSTPRASSRRRSGSPTPRRRSSAHPIALQLRFLQTLNEIASENSSTTIFPVPIDVFTPFLGKKSDKS